MGRFTVNYGLLWFDKTARFSNQTLENNTDVVEDKYKYFKEHWQHDIYAAVDIDKRFTFYGGVNNVFGQKPDIGTSTYPVNSIGRFLYAGAKVKLDKIF
jgi:outer membrane receptor protein involved in Fe transport